MQQLLACGLEAADLALAVPAIAAYGHATTPHARSLAMYALAQAHGAHFPPADPLPTHAATACLECGRLQITSQRLCACGTTNDTQLEFSTLEQRTEAAPVYYKRLNHLKEFLLQMTGETQGYVADVLVAALRKEMRKYRLAPTAVTPAWVHYFLRKLGCPSSTHEKTVKLVLILNPRYRSPTITPHMKNIIFRDFQQIEQAFNALPPEQRRYRKNIISCPFILFKIAQRRGWPELLPFIHLIRDERRLGIAECIFRACCVQLDWSYSLIQGNSVGYSQMQ